MTKWTKRRERFRSLLAGPNCVFPASVHDPISARIAAELGYELGMFAGSVASQTILGAPDKILITLSEFADQALRICRAGELPLLVDADHGYGNALNVMRTVEELETAGVAGLSIEDTALPQPYGQPGAELTSLEEGVGKVRAALAARADPALVIAGRTSAPAIAGIEETLRRAKAYEAAGADVVFLVGLKTLADLDAVAAEISVPLIIGGTGPGMDDPATLSARNVRVCLQGHQPFAAAVQAIYATMKALRSGTPPKEIAGLPEPSLMKRLMRAEDCADWEREFLG